jgi:hypothetical protein
MAPIPIIGQQAPSQAQQQAQAHAAIQAAVQQLSLGIYSDLAVDHLALHTTHPADPARLRQLAKDSLVAARAYFEGLGVIEIPTTQQPADQAQGDSDGQA